jgi:hypothetical protein
LFAAQAQAMEGVPTNGLYSNLLDQRGNLGQLIG